MTNGEIVEQALTELGAGWHTSREVMWQVRRNGYQMTTARAREICKVLVRRYRANSRIEAGRYSFKVSD